MMRALFAGYSFLIRQPVVQRIATGGRLVDVPEMPHFKATRVGRSLVYEAFRSPAGGRVIDFWRDEFGS